MDPNLPIDERVADLLSRMTMDEKIAQLGSVEPNENLTFPEELFKERTKNGTGQLTRIAGASRLGPKDSAEMANRLQKHLVENTRLGIPAMVHEECCSGYMACGATCFPQIIGVASAWTPELVEEMASVFRVQMRAVGAHEGLSPVIDIARDPRWGRTEETFGEDPYMVSRMGVAYIKGLQGPDLKGGIAATAKHYVGYGLSAGGMNWAPVFLPERELREVYMTPFEAAVKEAKLATLMNAYHELDGIPCGGSKRLLTEILRDEWGFDGIVVSDYHTIPMLDHYHHVAIDRADAARIALEAGLDIELPHTSCYGKPLRAAIEDGAVSEALIDETVARVLKMKFRLGIFEKPYVDPAAAEEVFDTPRQRSLALEIARKSMVLLKNKDNLLPLQKDLSSIAVIGPNADDARNLAGDYSHFSQIELAATAGATAQSSGGEKLPEGKPVPMTTILDGIKRKTSSATEVSYAKGCDVMGDSKDGFAEAVEAAKAADIAVVVVGDKSGLSLDCSSGEFRDRADIGLPGVQQQLVEAVCETGTPVVLVLMNGRPTSIPWIAENAPAILEAWLPGEEGGNAVADILFGDYNPGGKLPITIPRATGQIPIFYNRKPSGSRSFIYGDYVDCSMTPLFAFGHGLSYTQFEFDNLHIESPKAKIGESMRIGFDVENVGDREGDEVVQLYVHDAEAKVTRPIQELKGFKRLTLAPGETKTVTFTLFVNQLGFYNENMDFVVEPGAIEVMIGAASDDIRLSGQFEIVGEAADISHSKVFFSTAEVG
jgi:beta-glucosidase